MRSPFQVVPRDPEKEPVDRPRARRRRRVDGTDVISSRRGAKIDWSVPLGAGIVAPNMFPAQYSFDINATPDCVNDYVLFALNVAGVTGGQANLVE